MSRPHDPIVETMPDAILVVAPNGEILSANRSARAAIPAGVTGSLADLCRRLGLRREDGTVLDEQDVARLLAGEVETFELLLPASPAPRRVFGRATPVAHDADGPAGLVVTVRDVTDLVDRHRGRAQLQAAVATARRVAHDLNGLLATILLDAEEIPALGPAAAAEAAGRIVGAVSDAAVVIGRLQQLRRFAEADLGLGRPVLDLEAALD